MCHFDNLNPTPYLTASKSIDYVISDDDLAAGITALSSFDGLAACVQGELCQSRSPRSPSPLPAFHIHIIGSKVTVALYLQSKTLFFLPPFDRSLALPRNAKLSLPFVSASDQDVLPPQRLGRGSGAFVSTKYPVVVPRAHTLLEAFLRLYARNVETQYKNFAMAMVAYVEEYVDDDGFLDINLLVEPLKTFYLDLREGKKPVRQWTDEFKAALHDGTEVRGP